MTRRAILAATAVALGSVRLATAQGNQLDTSPPTAIIRAAAPAALAERLQANGPPVALKIGGKVVPLTFERLDADRFGAKHGSLQVILSMTRRAEHHAVQWRVTLRNDGHAPIEKVEITPLQLTWDIDPAAHFPRVRHMSGSNHYDGAFPPRAFRLSEERIMTHDHAKPIRIEAGPLGSTYDHSSVLQFAVGPYSRMVGLFVSFEWSARWSLEARWARNSFTGESRPPFLIEGSVGLNAIRLDPGETLALPAVHVGFWEGADWNASENAVRRYVRDIVAAKFGGRTPVPPVSYDHWFGIHQFFDVDDMKRQATRAAELGVQYFCLDAAWYPVKENFADGLGNWTADPKKFPRGIEELSAHVRKLGMGFGLWHMIEKAVPESTIVRAHPELFHKGTYLRLDMPAGRRLAIDTVRQWIRDWHLTWIRWELSDPQAWAYEVDPSGKVAFAHTNGLYEVIDTIRREHPDLYIEGVAGGGTRMDWGMAARTHGTWLSDHTAHPDVTRFMQMSASRFWPAHFLNMAVRVHRGSGDVDATPLGLLSRMVGTLSFNGDIAQWSPNATALAQSYVEIYKRIRDRLQGPVRFPLPQPASDRDWDVAVFEGEGASRPILFAFRIEGPDAIEIDVPGGRWVRIGGDAASSAVASHGKVRLSLPRNGAALFERQD